MLPGISPPPPFLVSPGTPAIPWPRWLRLFENFTLASGASELSAARRRALLLHCLGPEGQRIFDALPPPPPSNAPDHPPAHPSAGTAPFQTVTPSATTAAVGTTEIKQADAELAQPPDEYDAAVQALARHFSATCNVRVERHRFHGRTWNASQLSAVPKEASPEQGTNIDISGAHDMPPLTDCHRRDVPSKTWITTPAGPHQTQEASSADQLASPSRPVPLPVLPSPPQPQGSQPHTLASGSRTVECSVPVEGNGLDAEPPPDRPRRNRRPPVRFQDYVQ
ncbi:hypothetical protein HPB49_006726 [Dermacentor silvarum]|uniref:Uncharacterized protein n=1 Tax=Dermacentor silvarum TaxID=543639 RepID=A0ACB8DIC7_DERSI|nr:hypothetical protein HPB49_006726 [Dermacentor silvarum]